MSFNLVEIFLLLLVAAICGAIGRALTGSRSPGGCLVSIGAGLIGAYLGTWIGRSLGFGTLLAIQVGGVNFPIIWSMIGAAILVAVLSLLSGRR